MWNINFWTKNNFACADGLRYKSLMTTSRRHTPAPGFSLIELLVVVALIVIVIALAGSYGANRRQETQKQLCADNLQKIYLALQIYANDYKGGLPRNTNATTSEQVLDELVPKYTADTTIFICPGGRDSLLPSGEPLSRYMISYAYYMGRRLDDPQKVLLSDRQVNTEPKRAGEVIFSLNGKPPGNNHSKYGGNFLMADGSVQASGPQLTFSLAETPGVVLLNPRP